MTEGKQRIVPGSSAVILKQEIGAVEIDRFGKEKALNKFTTQVTEPRNLLSIFRSFRDDCELEGVSQSHYQAHDFNFVFIGFHPVHKGSINFQDIERKSTQAAQGRMPRTEIIDADPHPKAPQLA